MPVCRTFCELRRAESARPRPLRSHSENHIDSIAGHPNRFNCQLSNRSERESNSEQGVGYQKESYKVHLIDRIGGMISRSSLGVVCYATAEELKTNSHSQQSTDRTTAMASSCAFRRISGFAASSCARGSLRSRGFSVSTQLSNSSKSFGQGPAPPRLPKEEQEIFEQLQRQSTGAFSTPRTRPTVNQSPDSDTTSQAQPQKSSSDDTSGDGEELHPDVRKGARPEFEGDTNPRTGEVGGPKNEPLRWGAEGDWSFNGRVTDF